MKSDKVLRRIASMRRNDRRGVAAYVADLTPELRNAVLDSLTLPERTALEHLLKAREERRRARAIEDEKIREAHAEVAAKQEATHAAQLREFVDGLKAQRLAGDAGRFAAASRYTLARLTRFLSPQERQACKTYRQGENPTLRGRGPLRWRHTGLHRRGLERPPPPPRSKTSPGPFPT